MLTVIMFILFAEFTFVLCYFLALAATPPERLNAGRILAVLFPTLLLLLVGLFIVMPWLAAYQDPPVGLTVSGLVIAGVIAVLGLELLRVRFVGRRKGSSRDRPEA